MRIKWYLRCLFIFWVTIRVTLKAKIGRSSLLTESRTAACALSAVGALPCGGQPRRRARAGSDRAGTVVWDTAVTPKGETTRLPGLGSGQHPHYQCKIPCGVAVKSPRHARSASACASRIALGSRRFILPARQQVWLRSEQWQRRRLIACGRSADWLFSLCAWVWDGTANPYRSCPDSRTTGQKEPRQYRRATGY
jgi:hypothetical protein